jgi:hypothetical protein
VVTEVGAAQEDTILQVRLFFRACEFLRDAFAMFDSRATLSGLDEQEN